VEDVGLEWGVGRGTGPGDQGNQGELEADNLAAKLGYQIIRNIGLIDQHE
jgi:hypothetical protein